MKSHQGTYEAVDLLSFFWDMLALVLRLALIINLFATLFSLRENYMYHRLRYMLRCEN